MKYNKKPKINTKILDSYPVGIISSGFFMDGLKDSVWVAVKYEDGTWNIKYEHLPIDSNWYAENEEGRWDEWRERDLQDISENGTNLNILSRVNNIVRCTDKKVLSLYRIKST